ncbi:unnamed protein product [Cuscuta campestris]|uniref:Uncharacterized protein n=1 Tax=Cuscuta campestris TaxID=132261 RepID=A0A484KB38_9ASTE|nr:unnamed protein product [Cuscuta campestris]
MNVKEERESSLRNKAPSVNHEYLEAFRTKSYVEIYDKVQTQLATAGATRNHNNKEATRNNSLQHPHYQECDLLQLCHEALADELPHQQPSPHPLLDEYFHVSLEACRTCESLLQNVLRTRTDYHRNIATATAGLSASAELGPVYAKFASFSASRNPLSRVSQVRFNEAQDCHFSLLRRLISARRKLKRRMRLLGFLKKALGVSLVVGYAAFALASAALIAVHCAVVGLALASLSLFGGVSKKAMASRNKNKRTRAYAQLDAAAKGVYVLVNDFDTMSRLVGRLYDETEHNRAIAELCGRKQNDEMLREVVRGFAAHEGWFLEQLKELEQHIYLCFLNIIRSRRMVAQEIIN